MKSSATSLLSLINDILDFSKIEAGKLEIENIAFGLRHTLQETIKVLNLRARQKGLALSCQIPPELPDALLGDPTRLRQIVMNLVGNALKFTARGEVIVRAEMVRDGRRYSLRLPPRAPTASSSTSAWPTPASEFRWINRN